MPLGPSAGVPREIRVSGVASLADAQILHASADEIDATGLAPGFPALLRETWRDRGFGDFWGYALVAEGAAEAMIEVGPHSWDLAAPSVIVEEAGGRFTDLARRTVHPRWACARDQRCPARLDPAPPGRRLTRPSLAQVEAHQPSRPASAPRIDVSSTRVNPAASNVPVNPT